MNDGQELETGLVNTYIYSVGSSALVACSLLQFACFFLTLLAHLCLLHEMEIVWINPLYYPLLPVTSCLVVFDINLQTHPGRQCFDVLRTIDCESNRAKR